MSNLTGTQIEHYQVKALLGEGGMGTVYQAIDLNLSRSVALKVMHPQYARQSQFQQRFVQEAKSAARLEHPSIVAIHSFGSLSDLLYIDMEFVRGVTLGRHIEQLEQHGAVARLKETLHLIAQMADALGYAHRKGVIHRDIKPGNILVRHLEGPERPNEPPLRAIITDFGLAKLQVGGIQTQSGVLMGTLPYMSPEQLEGKDLDGRSDLYSLGIVLYQLAIGQLPFDIRSLADAVTKHRAVPPPDPNSVQPGLPPGISEIILKALAKQPVERYQTGEEMAGALREVFTGLSDDDITVFETANYSTVVSLATQVEIAPSPVQLPTQMMVDQPLAGTADQLVIAEKGKQPYTRPLDKQVITIGRGEENDLALVASGVSHHHARLERTGSGWQIVDLNSTNGTWLDNSKLLPGVPEPWYESQKIRIGSYFFSLRSAGQKAEITMVETAGFTSTWGSMPEATQAFSESGNLGLMINPTHVSVEPGRTVEMHVEMLNQGNQVDHFTLQIKSLTSDWYTLPADAQQLMPEEKGMWIVVFHPPRNSSAYSGQYFFQLVVYSQSKHGETAIISGSLTIEPFTEFSANIKPSILRRRNKTTLTITNGGNTTTVYQFEVIDPEDVVRLKSKKQELMIPPGKSTSLAVRIKRANHLWIGSTETYPFEVQIKTVRFFEGSEQFLGDSERWGINIAYYVLLVWAFLRKKQYPTHQIPQNPKELTMPKQEKSLPGKLEVRPVFPIRVLMSLLFMGLLVAVASVVLYIRLDSDGDGFTNLQEEPTCMNPYRYDSDEDDLSDYDEVNKYSTNPCNADHDNDGLTDGEEILVYSTNPRLPDSDGDGLPDGYEVYTSKTKPKMPDTDGDDVWDGTEVKAGTDPLSNPTPVPTQKPLDGPGEAVQNFYAIYIKNECDRSIQVAIRYYTFDNEWKTKAWWPLAPGESAYVAETRNAVFYIYAETTDSTGEILYWGGENFTSIPGRDEKFGFIEYEIPLETWGDIQLPLNCEDEN